MPPLPQTSFWYDLEFLVHGLVANEGLSLILPSVATWHQGFPVIILLSFYVPTLGKTTRLVLHFKTTACILLRHVAMAMAWHNVQRLDSGGNTSMGSYPCQTAVLTGIASV